MFVSWLPLRENTLQTNLCSSRAVTHSSLEWEVRGSNLGPVKLSTVLPTARHCSDISSKRAVLPAGAMTRSWASQTRYTLRSTTASIMIDLIYHFCVILLTCHIFKVLYLQVSFSRNFENLNDLITYNESSRYVFQIGKFYLECSASPLYSVLFFSLFFSGCRLMKQPI